MSPKNKKIQAQIKDAAEEAIGILSNDHSRGGLCGIYIIVNNENGEVSFLDDEGHTINELTIDEWAGDRQLDDNRIISILRHAMKELDNNDMFTPLYTYAPLPICYVDEELTVIDELLVIEDKLSEKSDGELINRFGKKFDDIIDNILKN